jgi:dimethylamine/trimethylamine dehydrogenase
LARELAAMREGGELDHIETLRSIGDAFVPGAIYAAVYAGHRAAREFGESIDPDDVGYIRELVSPANKQEERR